MTPEVLICSVPVGAFVIWFIVWPHSAAQFCARLYPERTHGNWYPQALRAGGVVMLPLMILILGGVLP